MVLLLIRVWRGFLRTHSLPGPLPLLAHMMLEAMTALLSLPRVTSHRLSRSRITVTRNLQ